MTTPMLARQTGRAAPLIMIATDEAIREQAAVRTLQPQTTMDKPASAIIFPADHGKQT